MTPDLRICQNCRKEFAISSDEFGMYEQLQAPAPKICVHCRWQELLTFWVFGKFRTGKSALSGAPLITLLPEKTNYPVYTYQEWISDAWEPPYRDYDPGRPFFDQLKDLQAISPRPHQVGMNNLNCDWCDDAWDCKNCYLARSMVTCEELLYGYRNINVKNSSDTTYCYNLERCYDTTFSFNCFNVRHSFNSRDCLNSAFLSDCRNVHDSFMCWNLRNKQYCIRNVQYSKEDYHAAMAEINLGSRKTIASLYHEYESMMREHVVHRENINVKNTNVVGNYLNGCKNCINAYHWEDSEDCFNILRGAKSKKIIDTIGAHKSLYWDTARTEVLRSHLSAAR